MSTIDPNRNQPRRRRATLRTAYSFIREPTGQLYEDVLTAALDECDVLGLICRLSSYPTTGEEALRALASALLEVEEVSEWPGSRLGAGFTTSLRRFRYDSEVKGVLLMFADSVLDWHNPDLPDDPHLLRRDGSTWLTSSTVDEGEVVLSLTTLEFESLRRRHPNVAAAVRPGLVVMPEDLRASEGNGDIQD